MKAYSICVAVLLGLAMPCCAANAQESQEPQAEPDTQQTAVEQDSGMRAPVSVTGVGPALLPTSEEKRNSITGAVRVSGLFSDNLINSFGNGGQRQSDHQYIVAPGIGLHLFRPRTQFRAEYSGGVTFDQRSQDRSGVTHDFEAYLQHDFTRRLSLELREGYLDSSDPFARFGPSQSLPSSFGPGQLNSLVVPTFADRIVNTTSADLNYQLSRYSIMGASGNFFNQRFRHTGSATGGSLIDSKAGAGRAFFGHQVTRGQEVGIEYQLQELRFENGQSRVATQSIFVFDEIALSPTMRLSLFAGPQHSHVRDSLSLTSNFSARSLSVLSDNWYPAAGATYSWRGKHTGLQLSALRTVTDGGGLQGASLSNSANFGIRRSFTPRWSAGWGLSYYDGNAVGVLNSNLNNKIRVEQTYLAIERTIMNNLTAQVRYLFWRQPRIVSHGVTTNPTHTNQIEVGLTYTFTRPL